MTIIVFSVLRAIASRPADSGFERPNVEGLHQQQVDAAVDELRQAGYAEAKHISRVGDDPPHWAPSVVTVTGRQLFEALAGKKKPV